MLVLGNGLARMALALALCGVGVPAYAQGLYSPAGIWLDDQGRTFNWQGLRGDYSVVNLAYGACRRVCSTSLRIMEQVQRSADARRLSLNFIVVAIDPELDRPADWAAFRVDHKLTRGNWQFLSGDRSSIQRLANRLGVRYWHYGDHVLHDFRIVLVAPDGRLVAALNAPDEDPRALLP